MMIPLLASIIGVFFTILLIVGIHELGHFSIARLMGVKVLRFSIGFGKKLLCGQDKQGTVYQFAAIPLGGYVQMLDENEGLVSPEDLPFAYNRQPFYKKLAIVIAGPLFNFIFAFLLYWIVYIIGFTTLTPVIGKIAPHSIAEQAGLLPQQIILQVDGKPTNSWSRVLMHISARSGDKDSMLFKTKSVNSLSSQTFKLNLANWQLNELKPEPLISLGIIPFEPTIPAVIANIAKGSPAALSPLKIGDHILTISQKPINDWPDFIETVVQHPDETLIFKVKRQQQTLDFPVTIGHKNSFLLQKKGFLGISPEIHLPSFMFNNNQYNPISALAHAWHDTLFFIKLNFLMIAKMITGKISMQGLGGPITIFQSSGAALYQGFTVFLSFLAFISISIGVINILPLPGLDGGHVLFLSLEKLTGKSLSPRLQQLVVRLSFIALFMVMIVALANDIARIS